MSRTTALLLYLALAGTIIGLDLWSKAAVFDYLGATIIQHPVHGPLIAEASPEGVREVPVFDSWFHLQASINIGAYNGMFGGQRTLLLLVSALWVVGSLGWICWRQRHEAGLTIAIALTAGGAFGNLWDRYFHHAVRDFIKWFVVIDGEAKVWPNFNIADAAICAGVGMILVREFVVARREKRERVAAEEAASAEESPSN